MRAYQNLEITGSIAVQGTSSANYFVGTLSGSVLGGVTNSITASYVSGTSVFGTVSSSYTSSIADTARTASFVAAASINGTVANAFTASYVATAQTASFVQTAQTASYVATAQTASYVVNSLTASYVATAQTASRVSGSNVIGTVSSSFTASFADLARTASYVNFAGVTVQNADTASVANKVRVSFGNNNDLTYKMLYASGTQGTLDVYESDKISVNGFTGYIQLSGISASEWYGVTTASYVTGAIHTAANPATVALTASYVATAQTASYITQLSQSVSVSGTLNVSGGLLLGSASLDPLAPEYIAIGQGTGSSYNLISAKSRVNNYSQIYITNLHNGTSASSDIVAQADNGSQTNMYVDLGINSSGYIDNLNGVGRANDGYVYGKARDFWVGNLTTASLNFFANPQGRVEASLQNGIIYVSNSLVVTGSITGSLQGTASFAATASYAVTASYSFVTQSVVFTASYVSGSNVNGTVSSSFTSSISDFTITLLTTASQAYTASNLAGTASWATRVLTANTASYIITAQTASYIGAGNTASYASWALTASFAISYSINSVTQSNVTSASWASSSLSASYVLTAVTASYVQTAQTASYVATAQTASYYNATASQAYTASYVSNLTQSLFVSGFISIGNISAVSTENTLNIFSPPGVGVGTGEGGQLMLAAQGGAYTSASMLDTYQNNLRIIKGTNSGGSNAEVQKWDLQTNNSTLNGSLILPNRPAFKVRGQSGPLQATSTPGGLVLSGSNLQAPDFNIGNYFSTASGRFTAPLTGLYQVNLTIRAGSNSNTVINQAIVYKSGSATNGNVAEIMVEYNTNTSMNHAGGSTISYLNAGDTLKAAVVVGTCSFDANDNFSVAFIG